MKIDAQPFFRRLCLLMGILAAAGLLLWILPFFYRCPVYALTGVPCPGCGVTRGAAALIRLDFAGAWSANPCTYLAVLYAGVFCLCILLGKTSLFRRAWVWWVFAAVFLTVYALRMILYFPHTPPMVFDSSALLPRIFAGFSG